MLYVFPLLPEFRVELVFEITVKTNSILMMNQSFLLVDAMIF